MTQRNVNDWNTQVIEEFRANGGKVKQFAHQPLLLLHTKGAKSGQERINPLAYLADGDRLLIFASRAGLPTNPDWYYNLLAHPDVTVEVGTEKFEATASVVEGEERDRLYAKQASVNPAFAEYQKKTTRRIPVIALVRKTS